MPTAPVRESSDDRCPGALRLHAADDGYVARVRVPGGRLAARQVAALCELADSLGESAIHLTSRGNLQVRGLSASAGAAVAAALHDAGLLPSLGHDRVRNVVASPFGGAAVEAALAAFDRALVADDRMVDLSGRFLFGIDDGTGDVLSLGPDLAIIPARGTWRLVVDGRATTVTGPAAELLVRAAHQFLDLRDTLEPTAWRVSDLGDHLQALSTSDGSAWTSVSTSDGSAKDGGEFLEAWVPLGVASTAAWRAVAALADNLRVTPWRSVVLVAPHDHEQARIALQHWGFLLSSDEPLARTTACIGRPGCASALTDVRRDALQLATQHAGRLHVSGCERRCGHPRGVRTEATARPGGDYLIELIEDPT